MTTQSDASGLKFGAAGRRSGYRDDLNFAEFPLAALSDRLPEGVKTLVFQDTIFDQGNRVPVNRTLTIAASDKYGLPTALDEEVILGLIQLTSEQKFTDRKVYFTRYELIRLLGWSEKGQSYRRIDESLRRWMGVTLYYENAWWSREDQTWVTEQFHILEQVSLLDRERRDKRRSLSEPNDPHAGKSFLLWNEVVWANFKAGHLKKLDFDFFKALSTPIAKRMYRFLDKHFYFRDTLEYKLRLFACEHIGLSREYHTGEMKRRLQSALTELETLGYLKALPAEERFVKLAPGEWKIVLTRASRNSVRSLPEGLSAEQEQAQKALVERGVGVKKAWQLAQNYAPEEIAEKVALHDWLKRRDDKRMAKPTGFLIKAIEDRYDIAAYPDFLKQRPRQTAKPTVSDRACPVADSTPNPAPDKKRGATHVSEEPEGASLAFEAFWSALEEKERLAFEALAVSQAEPFHLAQYHRGKEAGGTLFRVVRTRILLDHFTRTQPD
jgi:plasmid replication initiation protein